MSEYIKNLGDAIAAVHECRCSHFGSEHVREEHEGKLVWEGDVEIFQIEDHADARVAYGWAWQDSSNEIQYIGILNSPPINCANDAVKAAIASGNFLPIDGGKSLLSKEVRERAEMLKPMLERDLISFKNQQAIHSKEIEYADMIEYCPIFDSRTTLIDGLVVDENEVQELADKVGLKLDRGDQQQWPSFIFTH